MQNLTNINYKFFAATGILAAKGLLYQILPARPAGEVLGSTEYGENLSSGIGVEPSEGEFWVSDLKLGLKETADDLNLTEAVCSVSTSKNIVKTSLVGLSGTIKEYINSGDFQIDIYVGLTAIKDGKPVDRYPYDGVEKLRKILDAPQALYVDSDFLRLFDITKLVIESYDIKQSTHSNHQIISIRAVSDNDFEIKNTEY